MNISKSFKVPLLIYDLPGLPMAPCNPFGPLGPESPFGLIKKIKLIQGTSLKAK